MKGIIFVAIHQNLRELGDEDLRRQCFPEASAYLAFREYPDTDLVPIARAIAERVAAAAQPLGEVMRALGEEVVAVVRKMSPSLVPRADSFGGVLDLLRQHERDARLLLPRMLVKGEPDGRVGLHHTGDAAVCRFDEGLLVGLATAAGERVATRHPSCRSRRDAACVFYPRIVAGGPSSRPTSRTYRFSNQPLGGDDRDESDRSD